MLASGVLNKYVIIERPVESFSEHGEAVKSWQLVAAVWANIEPLTGRELNDSRQTGAYVSHRIRIRYRAGLDSAMRITWDGRTFNIGSIIDPGERRTELEIMATEVS